MKAIQITEPSVMKVIDIPEPQMGDDDVLLKMKYVGFCGSDLNTFRGGNPMVKMPVVPGHEVGAEIVKIGKNVPEGLKPGMTVTVNPYTNCGKCASCRNDRVNACEHNQTLGVQRWGAMCEYLALLPGESHPRRTADTPHLCINRTDECGFPCCQSCSGNRYRCRHGDWLWHGRYGCRRTLCPAWCYRHCGRHR